MSHWGAGSLQELKSVFFFEDQQWLPVGVFCFVLFLFLKELYGRGTCAKPSSFLLVISRCLLLSSDFLSWQSMLVNLLFRSCTSSWLHTHTHARTRAHTKLEVLYYLIFATVQHSRYSTVCTIVPSSGHILDCTTHSLSHLPSPNTKQNPAPHTKLEALYYLHYYALLKVQYVQFCHLVVTF